MLIQCQACKEYFEMPSQTEHAELAPEQESLCTECLIAHIEKLIYGKSKRMQERLEKADHLSRQAA